MSRMEKIAGRVIEFDKVYSLTFAGGKRELPKKDQKEYNRIMSLPSLDMQLKEKYRMKWHEKPELDPNVVPIKGIDLLAFIRELKFIPIFDTYFEHTGRLFLTNQLDYELIRARSKAKEK